ncbi:MAG: hypothetical protein HYZ85_03285, partial [Candidatus Omnitrophica bacterium]|nr:hypothetical protein [Candidatus Omnitrophota bacterium]
KFSAARDEGFETDSTPGVKKLFHPGSGVGFKPLVPRCGEFFHYKVVRSQDLHLGKDVLGLDLGFGNKHFPDFTLRNLKEGEILHVVRTKKSSTGDSYRFERAKPSVNRTPSGTFFHTYQAWVKNVVDDDTLWTEIDVGFRNTAEQKLRLRGINAAEIEKAKPASDFVKRTLAKVPFVVLSILGRDKFGRPLTDLFYLEGTDDRDKVAREGIYLNQQLLDLGLAVRMDD